MCDKNCNTCGVSDTKKTTIPYFLHEAGMARLERQIKRLWIALIVAILVAFGTNLAWMIYNAQFDKTFYSQDGEGINNINMGAQGDLNNGAESFDVSP